jgi:hypothetical protein
MPLQDLLPGLFTYVAASILFMDIFKVDAKTYGGWFCLYVDQFYNGKPA